jgi:hypothetical protein
MRMFFWIVAAIGAVLGAVQFAMIFSAESSPQQAAGAAMAVAVAAIPYIFARAIDRLAADPDSPNDTIFVPFTISRTEICDPKAWDERIAGATIRLEYKGDNAAFAHSEFGLLGSLDPTGARKISFLTGALGRPVVRLTQIDGSSQLGGQAIFGKNGPST